jgi:hypothetical protein
MKDVVAAVIFFLVTLTVLSQSVSLCPGEALTQRMGEELRYIARLR